MRGAATETQSPVTEPINGRAATDSVEPERPNIEALTPPATEALSPVQSPKLAQVDAPVTYDNNGNNYNNNNSQSPNNNPSPGFPLSNNDPRTSTPLYSAPSYQPSPHSATTDPRYGASSAKKRKLDAEFEGFGAGEDAMAGLDEDVAELLRAESGGAV
ncbi:MAG: hypothetical protein Q9183_008065 [Haloplaca sp. 2 TL-2023]